MQGSSLSLLEQWERELGDPASALAQIAFRTALELDEHELFPRAHVDALWRLGCFELLIPAGAGGGLREPEQLMFLGRLIARRDLTTAIVFGQAMLWSIPLWLAGTPAQQAQLARELRNGQLTCLALTEQAHGSDIIASELHARQHAGDWVLSGEKWLINNATRSASVVVLGRIEHADRAPEMALWWLHKPAQQIPQWREHPKIHTLGVRGADISGFELVEHPLAAAARLAAGEPALHTVLKTLQISRILCSSLSLGAIDTMFRLVLEFARQRQLYGKRVIDIPVVRARLARVFARICAADAVAQVTTRAIAALPGELSLLSAIAKYHVPMEVEAAARELSIVLGARHYVRDEPWGIFQKMMRDNQVVSLFDGSTQLNLSLIAAQLRALVAGLANPESCAGAQSLVELLRTEAGCEGWPEQNELRLNNQGMDSLAARFIHAESQLDPPCIRALRAEWRRWLTECAEATHVQRLPHDSVQIMTLAERYVTLHSCALFALVWQANREAGGTNPVDGLLLQLYVADKLPQASIEVSAADHSRALQAAIELVDQRRLLSFQRLHVS
jgi:alkylation response protein AidB-like acyl-CoA dehydrogenase